MIKRFFLSALLALSLFGCGTTYLDKVASAQVTNTQLVTLIGTAATQGKISKADANNLLKQTDIAEEGIKIAATLDSVSGADKLALAQTILNSTAAYLAKKGVK